MGAGWGGRAVKIVPSWPRKKMTITDGSVEGENVADGSRETGNAEQRNRKKKREKKEKKKRTDLGDVVAGEEPVRDLSHRQPASVPSAWAWICFGKIS